MKLFCLTWVYILFCFCSKAKDNDSLPKPKIPFQIFLDKEIKEIKWLMYDKNFLPLQGKISLDKKSVIMPDYEKGNKIRMKVIYEDGTSEEIMRTPCFIDPVVWLKPEKTSYFSS